MTIKLREGGVYFTREGEEVGPLFRREDPEYNWTDGVRSWTGSGSILAGWGNHPLDLVSEVTAPLPPLWT